MYWVFFLLCFFFGIEISSTLLSVGKHTSPNILFIINKKKDYKKKDYKKKDYKKNYHKIKKGECLKKVKNFHTFLWGYPIYDDSPSKLRRPKIYPNYEYGELRKSQDFDYVISTNISQDNYTIPNVGYLFKVDEMGTGRTDDIHTPIDVVFGKQDIDMKEVAKIKSVLNIFDQGNGLGICTLMGAKRGHFAFKYNGYLRDFYGIKNYLRFVINKHYPGARVTLISEHWIDAVDKAVCNRHCNIPFSKIGYQRRLIFGKYDYIYENDKNKRIYKGENKSNVWAFYDDPQMLT